MTRAEFAKLLADKREQAQILRAHGHVAQAKSVDDVVDDVAAMMRPFLTTLSENEAALRSGWTPRRLRGEFAGWESMGFAELDEKGKRRYCECIVPVRAERSIDRLAGERGESLRKSRHA